MLPSKKQEIPSGLPEPCSVNAAEDSDSNESDAVAMSEEIEPSDSDVENNDHLNDGDANGDTDDDDDDGGDEEVDYDVQSDGENISDDMDSSNDSLLSGSDSDMSEENNEAAEAIRVPLPDEFAELAAGREDADCDDDDVIQAILRAREKHRNHPPSIEIEDGVAALSFHPQADIIAVGTFTGDVAVYKYSDEDCELLNTHELHMKAIREVEFSKDGRSLFTTSKDKSVLMSDVETGKLTNIWEQAHSSPVHALYILDENRFCSGCEEGHVKLWDARQQEPIFSFRVMEDMVNAIVSTPQNRHLAVACGGTITSINVNAKKVQVQSEEYAHDFTCLGLFRCDTKLLAGSSKGTTYLFNWGEFGYHSDEFTGFKQPVSCLLPVTETVAITGWEDGKIRATHLFPHKPLGIVGQHDFSVECLDISGKGTIIASAAAAGGFVKFWNIKYIEEVHVKREKQKKKRIEHNLPSSSVRNHAEFFAGFAE